MEPQLPSPVSPEHLPPQPTRERLSVSGTPEAAPERVSGGERQETREMAPAGPSEPVAQPAAQAPPPLPQIVPIADSTSRQSISDDTPLIAADEDLIEKEWVEKAKKVISQTKHDPYLQEQAVSKLQADYLQKRYNKTIKVPNETS